MYLCIEILGESAFHKFLIQSGWSGKDYVFHYNRHTNSHMRAYRSLEDYYAERIDMHKSVNIWPLLGNMLPEERIEPQVFSDAGGKSAPRVEKAAFGGRKGRARVEVAMEKSSEPEEPACR
ncbi:MAG: hypothetical protein WCP06_03020 [Verrucomicrobiota bacterium]